MASDTYSSGSPDTASDLKSTVSDLGKKAADGIDGSRTAAAERIASAAMSVEGRAENLPGGPRVASLAHSTADKLTATADYIREHDVNAMFQDVQAIVKKNPVPALLGAAALGFLLAKAFSRD